MTDSTGFWLAIVALSATTWVTRASFIVMGEKSRLPSVLQRALRHAPVAALSALVVPELLLDKGVLAPFNPKLLAGLVVAAIAFRTRNPWLPFILGMGVLIALRGGIAV